MKKTLLTIAIALTAYTASAQKLLKPEVDKISGDTTWKTSEEALYAKLTLVGANELVTIQPVKDHSVCFVWICITKPKTDNKLYSILSGDKTILKLSDKSLINLTAAKNNLTEMMGSNTKTYGSVGEGTKTLTPYAITKEDLQKLQTSPIEFVRISTTNGDQDYDVKPKMGEKVRKTFELIASK
ncbi:hypothetical protein [Mucilaginibacter aquatilis]|uniref:Uncharacterized protein n=1 Tax=Mucilaginibacter aquatilis TaxID=1517760 RepID=A0A6I4I6K6_9SPHI|nr:hypothetical protein [Mucilaginibacter aquatilis]MVN90780.1 hypothetical protein [Mucilaginibacter aquatilis]